MPDAEAGRLQNTKLNEFSQILVIGQKYLNDSFKTLFKLSADTKEHSLLNFNVKSLLGGASNCILDAPRVDLDVMGGMGSLTYTLKIKSGDAWVFADDSGTTKVEVKINNWEIPFTVPIETSFHPVGSDEHSKLADRFKGFANDQFSLYKIYLDCSQAKGTLPGTGNYNGFDWASKPDAFTNWQTMVQKYINGCGNKHENILGLIAQPKDGVGAPATYPPKWLARQTYAYINPDDKDAKATNGHDSNGLMYLMVSAPDETPKSATFLPAKDCGNWLVPGKIDGTYSLKRAFFFDQYLLPRIYDMCKGVTMRAGNHTSVTVNGNGASQGFSSNYDIYYGGGIPYSENSNNHTDHFYWGSLPTNDFRPEMQPLGASNFYMGIVKEFPPHASDVAGLNANPLFKVDVDLSSWNWFTVTFNPGSSRIVVEGRSNMDCTADYSGTNTPIKRTYEHAWFHVRWKVYIDIESVEASINLKVTWDESKKEHWDLSHAFDDASLQGTAVPYHFKDDWPGRFNGLEHNFTEQFKQFEGTLANGLRDQGKLFLPGNGVLLFKNGTFNTEGDLLVEVKFDCGNTGLP